MDIIKSNIHNLTALWEIAGEAIHTLHKSGPIGYCYIPGSQWPNRVWAGQELTQEQLSKVEEIIHNTNTNLSFSWFGTKTDSGNKRFAAAGFTEKSIQYGMSLPLQQPFATSIELDFRRVAGKADARIWSEAFAQSFGYIISDETIVKTQRKIPYELVYHNNALVGTVILFQTGNTAGVHSLGVVPEMRRQGFASEVMYHTLNRAIGAKAALATLQASTMARLMYEKMGFSLDFLMKNYRLKN